MPSTWGSNSFWGSGYRNDCDQTAFGGGPKEEDSPYTKFEVISFYAHNGWTLIEVRFKESHNYNGVKILLYDRLLGGVPKYIDPHFNEDDEITPFARFRPTNEGWAAAMKLMEMKR